jgi:hypothetical protein
MRINNKTYMCWYTPSYIYSVTNYMYMLNFLLYVIGMYIIYNYIISLWNFLRP